MKKVLLILLLLCLIPSGVFASFACGKVNSYKDFSSMGFYVNVRYDENLLNYTTCRISSTDLKFCCDLEAISGVNWAVGKSVSAEVFDPTLGYAAGPVKLTISGEGYDVFPEMNLKKIIEVSPAIDRIYVNNNANKNKILLNISTLSGFNNINFSISYGGKIQEKELCKNCNFAVLNLSNLSYGNYNLEIKAYGDKVVKQDFNVTFLKYLNFDRQFICSGCRKNFVPSNKIVNVSVSIDASDNITGIFQDYFPSDWISMDNNTDTFSDTSSVIKWDVNGAHFSGSYVLKSPSYILPRTYAFQSEFEGTQSSKSYLRLYHIYMPFFVIYIAKVNINSLNYNYSRASPSSPLIVKFKNKPLELVSILPKKDISKASLGVIFDSSSFEVLSSISNKDIDNILVRIKKPISSLESIDIIDVASGNITKATNSISDDSYKYYDAYLTKKGKFRIL